MVTIKEKQINIPTYKVGSYDKNPMFYEKRVYQGSSGKVYPLPIIDKIFDDKTDELYECIILENEYIQVTILPSLGGRIWRARDKTNGYDFVYFNEVIKPALVGLAGPWISGGIEFNWPQHHRPTTFMPVEYNITRGDGFVSLDLSEIDRLYGTEVHVSYVLYEGRAYIQIKGSFHNGTDVPQTFLWWANPAVSVNENTQSIFPPDVTAVYDHGKRDVSSFPIAKKTYYKVDFSQGVDISKYKNIPVPMSYMAYKSKYDFIGGYDFSKRAGLLHVADHHISPGKKQWTWGNGQFGQAWDDNLTDANGPYVELMTGIYTDNQPDFSWLAPHETKDFCQYFMPYRDVGVVKNANRDFVFGIDINDGQAHVTVYATALFSNLKLIFQTKETTSEISILSISPSQTFKTKINLENEEETYSFTILDKCGKELLQYQHEIIVEEVPEPAKAPLKPEHVVDNDELFFIATHLLQYRHATYRPEDYCLEGLARDKFDVRINTLYAKILFEKGLPKKALEYVNHGLKRQLSYNERPFDGELLYVKGLILNTLDRYSEAYDFFSKATWSQNMKAVAFYQLALLDVRFGKSHERKGNFEDAQTNYQNAQTHIEQCMSGSYQDFSGFGLLLTINRLLKYRQNENIFQQDIYSKCPLNYHVRYERYLSEAQAAESLAFLKDNFHICLELSTEYSQAGLYEDAIAVLDSYCDRSGRISPLYYYHKAHYQRQIDASIDITALLSAGEKANSYLCFPNKLETCVALESLLKDNPDLPMVAYYLGNYYYDRQVFDKAISLWEKAASSEIPFPTVYRNLAIAQFNKLHDWRRADQLYATAFSLDKTDARILYEYDQLKKRCHRPIEERFELLSSSINLVFERDDLLLEYVTLLNIGERFDQAVQILSNHRFHVWEGGEGKVAEQYIIAMIGAAKLCFSDQRALDYLTAAIDYPKNLGEGKLIIYTDNNVFYYLGRFYKLRGETHTANHWFELAAAGSSTICNPLFYNDQPAEMVFYQAVALLELGRDIEASTKLSLLEEFADKHEEDQVEIDYFAVSLPNYLIFDDDLTLRNRLFCRYIRGLAWYGRGKIAEAKEIFKDIIRANPSFLGLVNIRELLK